jgi:hypothetical protein
LIVDHGRVVGNGTRAAIISDRRITGLSADMIAELVAQIGPSTHRASTEPGAVQMSKVELYAAI